MKNNGKKNTIKKNDKEKLRNNLKKNSIYSDNNTKKSLYSNPNEKVTERGLKDNKHEELKFQNLNDQELNNLEYQYAIKYDKRTYFQYYWSLLKKKQLILFTFFPNNDYNLVYIKIALFIISFSLYFTINGFFF